MAPAGFFVTSVGSGMDGGNLGGLEGGGWGGAQDLGRGAGHDDRTWHAYLSRSDAGGQGVVHARDRIGSGPWFNLAGELIARDVDELHTNGILPALMLDEYGAPAGVDSPPGSEHDILTGSDQDGTLAGAGLTCNDWTSSGPGPSVRVGHHDWQDIKMPMTMNQNWNSVHSTGCTPTSIADNLGSGRLYCFAIDE